jgi:hypothetical protein
MTYLDHEGAGAVTHVLILGAEEHCHVMFRKERRRGWPLFASVLYVSNPGLFRRTALFFYAHLLRRFGIPFTLAELRIVPERPRFSFMLTTPRPKMYRSAKLRPEQIDYLYSELTCVAW